MALHPASTRYYFASASRGQAGPFSCEVLAAAAGGSEPSLFRALNVQLLRTFAETVVVGNKKNLELVQSMLIMAVWPFPPDSFRDLNYSQYMHLAVTMAMDLGLEDELTEPNSNQALQPGGNFTYEQIDSEWQRMEKRSAMLGCFLLCSGRVSPHRLRLSR